MNYRNTEETLYPNFASNFRAAFNWVSTEAAIIPGFLICISAFALALAFFPFLSKFIQIPFSWDGELISKAVILGYPKKQETITYLALLIFLPLTTLFCLLEWLVWSCLAAGRLKQNLAQKSLPKILVSDSFIHLILIFAIFSSLYSSKYLSSYFLLIAISAFLLVKIFFALKPNHLINIKLLEIKESNSEVSTDLINKELLKKFDYLFILIISGLGLFFSFKWKLIWFKNDLALTCKIPFVIGTLLALGLIFLLKKALHWKNQSQADGWAALCCFVLPLIMIPFFSWHNCWFYLAALISMMILWLAPAINDKYRDNSRKLFWWIIVPIVLAALSYNKNLDGSPDLYHEGERLTTGYQMLLGKVPYQDLYLWHGYGEDGLKPYLFLKYFGTTLRDFRKFCHILDLTAIPALYFMAASLLGSYSRAGLFILFLIFSGAIPDFRYLFVFLSITSFCCWIRSSRKIWSFLTGFGLGLGIIYSLDGGMGLLAALIAFIFCLLMRNFFSKPTKIALLPSFFLIILGLICSLSGLLAYFYYQNALAGYLKISAQLIFNFQDRSSVPFNYFLSLLDRKNSYLELSHLFFGKSSYLLIGVLSTLVCASGITFSMFRRGRKPQNIMLIFSFILAVVFVRVLIRRPDSEHLSRVIPFLALPWLIIFYEFFKIWNSFKKSQIYPKTGLLFIILIAALGAFFPIKLAAVGCPDHFIYSYYESSELNEWLTETMSLPRSGVIKCDPEAINTQNLVLYLNQHLLEEETFYDFTNSGLLYFLAEKPIPTPYTQTVYASFPASQQEVVDNLKKTRPRLVTLVSSDSSKQFDGIDYYVRLPMVADFIFQAYQPMKVVNEVLILESKTRIEPRESELEFNRAVLFQYPPVNLELLPYHLSYQQSGNNGIWKQKDKPHLNWDFPEPISKWDSPPLDLDPDQVAWLQIQVNSANTNIGLLSWGWRAFNNLGSDEIKFKICAGENLYRLPVFCLPQWRLRDQIKNINLSFEDNNQSSIDILKIELFEKS